MNVVYDILDRELWVLILQETLVVICVTAIPVFSFVFFRKFGQKNNKLISVMSFICIICLGLCIWSAIDYLNGVIDTYQTYENGDYSVVRGCVTDYISYEDNGNINMRKQEEFKVSGVDFIFSYGSSRVYYNKIASQGGAITGNGINVEIHYIENETGTKEIMKLIILE